MENFVEFRDTAARAGAAEGRRRDEDRGFAARAGTDCFGSGIVYFYVDI